LCWYRTKGQICAIKKGRCHIRGAVTSKTKSRRTRLGVRCQMI
jgi:hypothetical protein